MNLFSWHRFSFALKVSSFSVRDLSLESILELRWVRGLQTVALRKCPYEIWNWAAPMWLLCRRFDLWLTLCGVAEARGLTETDRCWWWVHLPNEVRACRERNYKPRARLKFTINVGILPEGYAGITHPDLHTPKMYALKFGHGLKALGFNVARVSSRSPGRSEHWVQISAWSLTSCMTLGRLLLSGI